MGVRTISYAPNPVLLDRDKKLPTLIAMAGEQTPLLKSDEAIMGSETPGEFVFPVPGILTSRRRAPPDPVRMFVAKS